MKKNNTMKTVANPILRGFNPDPSILRTGDDYYIATSTFEWFPGVLIHHSRDLVHWRVISRPLDRLDQLDMRGEPDSCGVWAPCLSYHDGLFYLVYTDVKNNFEPMCSKHNYLVTAPDITGPWSDRIYLFSDGYDPSLFHDGDRKWLVWTRWDYRKTYLIQSKQTKYSGLLRYYKKFGKSLFNPSTGITMQEYSPDKKSLIGEKKIIFEGSKLGLTEGPHLYRRGDYYYLMTAEGGSGKNHAVTLARSKTIHGPYEVHPENPVLTSRGNKKVLLQKSGHASLVETVDGQWYMPHLCSRPVQGTRQYRCPLGRETALQKVVWGDDGWLRLEGGGNAPRTEVPVPILPEWEPAPIPARDDFDSTAL